MGLEPVLQLGQALVFLLLDGAGGDLRPQLDHAGETLQGQAGGLDGGQLLLLLEQLKLLAPQLGQALVGLVAGVGHHDLPLYGDVVQLLLQLQLPGQVLVPEVHVRAGLVDEVNGLVRQEAVGDIALGHQHRQAGDVGGNFDVVELLVIGGHALDDLHGVLDGRLVHDHGLEAAL